MPGKKNSLGYAQTINNTFDILKWAQNCLIHCIYEIKIRFNNTTQNPSNMSITYGDASESHTAIAKSRSVSNQYEKKRGESRVYSINKGKKTRWSHETKPNIRCGGRGRYGKATCVKSIWEFKVKKRKYENQTEKSSKVKKLAKPFARS